MFVCVRLSTIRYIHDRIFLLSPKARETREAKRQRKRNGPKSYFGNPTIVYEIGMLASCVAFTLVVFPLQRTLRALWKQARNSLVIQGSEDI